MAIGFRSGTTLAGNLSSIAITLPATWQTGDFMVAAIAGGSTALAGVTTPTGWTLLGNVTMSGSGAAIYIGKVATSGDPGSTLNIPLAATQHVSIAIAAWSGVDTTTPVNQKSMVAESVAGTTHTDPTITSTAAGWVVGGVMDRGSPGSTSFTAPGGTTKRIEIYDTGGGSCSIAMADSAANVAAGSVSGGTWTGTLSTATAAMFTIALNPSSTAPTSAATTAYDWLPNHLSNQLIDLDSDTIKAILVNGYTYNTAHNFYDDITGELSTANGYTHGGQTLTTKSLTTNTTAHTTVWTSDPLVWTASGGSLVATGCVLYKDTGSAPTSPLIGYIDFGGTATILNTYSLEIDPDATNGWLLISKG
jgi:hypothetical protein